MQDDNEKSALTWAAQSDQLPVVEFLLKVGAQPLTPDSNGKHPIMFAIDNEATSVIKAILKSVDEYSGAVKGNSTPLSRSHATQALLYAAKTGKSKACEVLIKHGANVHVMDDNKKTPLSLAIQSNNIEIVKMLLQEGVNVNSVDTHHQTPLSIAVKSDNIEIVQMLLKEGAKPDRADLELSILPYAYDTNPPRVKHNNTAIFKLLLEHGADPRGDVDQTKMGIGIYTPIIHRVMTFQNAEMLETLFKDYGFNANERGGHGYSLLGHATGDFFYGDKQSKLVDCLLAAGHDFTYQEHGGGAAFLNFMKKYPAQEKFKEIGPTESAEFHQFMDPTIGVFIKHIKAQKLEAAVLMPAVKHAIESNNMGLIDVMCQQGLDINQKDVQGYTPLMYAILENNPKLIEELLKKGADPYLANKSKENAFDVAINNDKVEEFTALLKSAELKDTAALANFVKDTAFTAAKEGKSAILSKLMQLTENLPNVQDKEGYTLLMHAVKSGKTEIVKQLVERKDIDLTLKNPRGETAFNLALNSGSGEIKSIITNAMVTQKGASKGDQIDTAQLPRAKPVQRHTTL